MRIDDVDVPTLDVKGYPQLRMVEPSLTDLDEIGARFSGLPEAPEGASEEEQELVQQARRQQLGENIVWLFAHFVRDTDGDRIEGIDTVDEAMAIRPSMIKALTAAVQGSEDTGPLA